MSLTDTFLTDFAHKGDYLVTPGGDLDLISGLANLKNALLHRLITVPGSLVHRPNYGCGLPSFLNGLSSFATQQRFAAIIREQFKRDPRVEDVSSISIDSEDNNPQLTAIVVRVKPVGYSEEEMKFTDF